MVRRCISAFGSYVTLAIGLTKARPLLALRRSNVLPLRHLATLFFYHLVTPTLGFSSALPLHLGAWPFQHSSTLALGRHKAVAVLCQSGDPPIRFSAAPEFGCSALGNSGTRPVGTYLPSLRALQRLARQLLLDRSATPVLGHSSSWSRTSPPFRDIFDSMVQHSCLHLRFLACLFACVRACVRACVLHQTIWPSLAPGAQKSRHSAFPGDQPLLRAALGNLRRLAAPVLRSLAVPAGYRNPLALANCGARPACSNAPSQCISLGCSGI